MHPCTSSIFAILHCRDIDFQVCQHPINTVKVSSLENLREFEQAPEYAISPHGHKRIHDYAKGHSTLFGNTAFFASAEPRNNSS